MSYAYMEKTKTERLVAWEQNQKKSNNPFLLSSTVDIFDSLVACSLPSYSKEEGCLFIPQTWVGLASFEQGCCGQSLNDPQGPWTTDRGGATYDLAGKNGDKHCTPAAGCSFIAPLKNKD